MTNSDRSEAISTLMELMGDENDEVRNWATFQLALAYSADGTGRLGTLDSEEIRDAFRKRLQDSFVDVRDEAVWGLARRKDPAALQMLLERLGSDEQFDGDLMAAAEILDRKYDTPVGELQCGLRALLSS